MNRSSRTRRLALEPLDDRYCLAGNVSVSVFDFAPNLGELRMIGDGVSNTVAVWKGENPGEYVVAGGQSAGGVNTLVNGQTGPVTFTGVTRFFSAMGGGNDKVLITKSDFTQNIYEKNIKCDMGGGSDTLILRGNVPATADLELNNGGAIPYGPVSAIGLLFNGNIGNDALRIYNATISTPSSSNWSIDFTGGDGDDVFQVDGIGVDHNQIGSALLDMGQGTDLIRVARARIDGNVFFNHDPAQGPLRIDMFNVRCGFLAGRALDELSIDSVADPAQYSVFNGIAVEVLHLATLRHIQANGISLTGGGGNDDVAVSDTNCNALHVQLAEEDDELSLQNVTVLNETLLNGGAGTDTYVDLGGNTLGGLSQTNFEG